MSIDDHCDDSCSDSYPTPGIELVTTDSINCQIDPFLKPTLTERLTDFTDNLAMNNPRAYGFLRVLSYMGTYYF